jgi:hypothetical protein
MKNERFLDRLNDYSDESIFSELHRIRTFVGKETVTIEDVEKNGRLSYAVIKKRFGGLRVALIQAGIKTTIAQKHPSTDQLLEDLGAVWDATLTHEGRRPYRRDLRKYGARYSSNTYERHFGSWIKACEALLEWEGSKHNSAILSVTVTEEERPRRKQKRPIPLRIRYAILMRDRFTCKRCGRSPSTTPGLEVDVDHIKPEAKGGTLENSNLQCLCSDCNIGKSDFVE